jgi:hypothetical protein
MRRLLVSMMIFLSLTVGFIPQRANACSIGFMKCEQTAAWVTATGASITSFTLALVTDFYLTLNSGFTTINAQINANTQSFVEGMSYQGQAIAQVRRQAETTRAAQNATRPPTYTTQAVATNAAAGAQLQTDLARASIQQQNYLYARNMDPLTQFSRGPNDALILNQHFTKFCGERDHLMGLCVKNTEKPRMIDADLNASTIFDQPTIEAELEAGAVAFSRNVVGGAVPTRPTNNEMRMMQGVAKMTDRNTHDARSMLAFDTMDHLVALRTEIPNEKLKDWAKAMVKKLTGGVGMAASYNGYSFGQNCGSSDAAGFMDITLTGDICKPFKAGMIMYAEKNGPTPTAINQAQADVFNLYYTTLKSQGMTQTAAIIYTLHIYNEIFMDNRAIAITGGEEPWVNWNGCIGTGQFCGVKGYNSARALGAYLVARSDIPTKGYINPKTGVMWKACEFIPTAVTAAGGCAGGIADAVQNGAIGLVQAFKSEFYYKTAWEHASTPGMSSSAIVNNSIKFGIAPDGFVQDQREKNYNRIMAENQAQFQAGANDCSSAGNTQVATSGTPAATPSTPAPPSTAPSSTPTATPGTTLTGATNLPSGQYILMRPNGKKDQYGGELYDLSLMNGTAVVETVEVVSGQPGKDHVPAAQDTPGSMRAIPSGTWGIGAVDSAPDLPAEVKPIFIPILTPGISRSAFGFHFDNDRATKPGTAGCVGTLDMSTLNTIVKWVNGGAKTLVVNHDMKGGNGETCTGETNPIYILESGDGGKVIPGKGVAGIGRHWPGTGGYCGNNYIGPPDRNGQPHCDRYRDGNIVLDIFSTSQVRGMKTPAPGDGVIYAYGPSGDGCGIMVGINFTNNNGKVLMCHFDRLAPDLGVGKPVKYGQYIGDMGDTGSAKGLHWHTQHMSVPMTSRWLNSLTTGIWDGVCLGDGMSGGPSGGACSSPTADLGINELSERTSHAELMKVISTYRFMDPAWNDFVTQSASPFQLLRDIATMHSISMYNDWQRYQLKQRVAAMTGAIAATDVEMLRKSKESPE